MNNIGEIISNFEGIIGALLGVIVTLILTHILKHFEQIKFYIVDFEIYFKTDNDGWGTNVMPSKDEAKQIEIHSQIEIYNGAEIPKVLREIKFCFYKNTNLIVSVTPDDKATTEEFAEFGYYRDKLFNINLPSKQIIAINIIKFLNEKETKQVKKCNRVYLEAKDHNGKMYKVFLGEF